MEVKIIKKGSNLVNKKEGSHLNQNKKQNFSEEKKVEQSVSGWISELREKKKYEFLKARLILGNL
jgi:flagellar biosynthesis chaperone FliJ